VARGAASREDTGSLPDLHGHRVIPLPLVPLSADERAHEARVADAVRAAIATAGGWLPFAQYMDLVLYAPSLGYYAAGAHKLGAGGDFVTAPELSPVFGRCVATQCAEVLAFVGGGEILEIGAGSGALAADILATLAELGAPPSRYRILETSPDLRARQAARLAVLPGGLGTRVEWIDRPPATPFAGVVLANEVLDALPVERFTVVADGVEELGVGAVGAGFALVARQAGSDLLRAVADLGMPLPAGYASEACLRLGAWLRSVTAPLARGAALFLDYGLARRAYYAPDRDGGTFACFHRHRRHEDPFVNMGLQDLTAWVDFTRVAEAALAAGLEVGGYTTQANFLLGTRFEQHLAAYRTTLDAGSEPLAARRAMQLVLPVAMGERFKAIALLRDYQGPLSGFSLRDFTATL
jgi:SAM-dependent MidA family methyltransferase